MINRLLFLDFDGVLHPYFPLPGNTDAQNAYFANVRAFEAVLEQHPTVGVVISSTWRKTRSLDELRAFFSEEFRPRIIGKTPVVPGQDPRGMRQLEIEQWLADNGHADTPWVALDDVPAEFMPGAAVVVTPDYFGLIEATHLMKALANPADWAVRMPVPDVAEHEKAHLQVRACRASAEGQE